MSCTVVVAEYDSPRDCALVRQWAPPECLVHVYSKSDSCSRILSGIDSAQRGRVLCEALPNRGRDLGTHLHYILAHYESLPDRVHFVPAALHKYNRGGMFKAFLASADQPFMCASSQRNRKGVAAGVRIPTAVGYAHHRSRATGAPAGGTASSGPFLPPTSEPHTFADPRGCYANTGYGVSCLEFEMPLYKGTAVARSTAHPLRQFVARHLGGWVSEEQLGRGVVCLNGIFASTRHNLLRYPPHVYRQLMNETDVADASEAVHMVERLAQVVFGAATLQGGTVLVRNESQYSHG